MCSLSFIFLLLVNHLLSTGPHSHQQALDACLKHFVGSMISLMKVLLNCSSIIACLICLWSHACSWSHLLARSLCHPLFHLINLLLEAITPYLLAKSLVFSGALTFDRPIARTLARPLNPLPNFSPTCSLAHFPASLLACSFPIILINPKTRKKNSRRIGWVAG